MLIVNADDFGLSSQVNRAVAQAFERNLVSSATVMANMPSFEEACAMTVERRWQRHVGTHLVLTAGDPLTDGIRRHQRFCDADGRFRSHRSGGRVLRLNGDERRALQEELAAQVDACRRR